MASINAYKILTASLELRQFTRGDIAEKTGVNLQTVGTYFNRKKAYFEDAGAKRTPGNRRPEQFKQICAEKLPDVLAEIRELEAVVGVGNVSVVENNRPDDGIFIPNYGVIADLVAQFKDIDDFELREHVVTAARTRLTIEENLVRERKSLGVSVEHTACERLQELHLAIDWYEYELDNIVDFCIGKTALDITNWLFSCVSSLGMGSQQVAQPFPAAIGRDFFRLIDVIRALEKNNSELAGVFRVSSVAAMGALRGVKPMEPDIEHRFYLYCCQIDAEKLATALRSQYRPSAVTENDQNQLFRILAGLELVSELPSSCNDILSWFHSVSDAPNCPLSILPAIAELWKATGGGPEQGLFNGFIASQQEKIEAFLDEFSDINEFIAAMPSVCSEETLKANWATLQRAASRLDAMSISISEISPAPSPDKDNNQLSQHMATIYGTSQLRSVAQERFGLQQAS